MTLLEVKYRNTDVSGGVRTPPLIQIMYTYVCTHGHCTHAKHQATHDSKCSCKGEVGTVAACGDDDSRGSESVVVMRRSL